MGTPVCVIIRVTKDTITQFTKITKINLSLCRVDEAKRLLGKSRECYLGQCRNKMQQVKIASLPALCRVSSQYPEGSSGYVLVNSENPVWIDAIAPELRLSENFQSSGGGGGVGVGVGVSFEVYWI